MQYEEKSNLENRIIAHFDGSLDNASSSSLLDEVMASPEKRALFRAHETLNSVIASARVPMEAPLETKREIADRIPGLIAFIPGLLGTAETMPILQQSTNPFITFFARMSLQTALSIGSAVLVLTTAGIIVKNNLDNNAAQTPKIAVVQNASPAMRQARANSASQNYGMIPSQNQNIASTNHESASSILMKHTSPNASTSANAVPAQSSIISTNNGLSANGNLSSQNKASSDESDQPLVSNAFDAPKSSPAKVADIPVMQPQILMPIPDEVSEGITVRPYISNTNRFVQLNGISGSSTSKFVSGYLAGLEFEIGDRYAFRVQGGQSGFAQVTYVPDRSAKIVSLIPGLTAFQPAMFAQTANWATVGMSYSIPITSSIPFILSADGGAVFLNKTGIMGILGAAADFPVFSNLTLRPQVTYDLVSSYISPVSPSSGNVIIENSIKQPSMLTNAFGFQANLMFRF